MELADIYRLQFMTGNQALSMRPGPTVRHLLRNRRGPAAVARRWAGVVQKVEARP